VPGTEGQAFNDVVGGIVLSAEQDVAVSSWGETPSR